MTHPPISKRSDVPPFIVMDIMEQARLAQAQGEAIVHLEVGEPSRPTHPHIINAVNAAFDQQRSIGYTVALGIPELRARISHYYKEFYGLSIPAERIILTNGSSGAFVLAFLSALEHGGTLAVPNPGYPAYRHTAQLLGLNTVMMQTSAATDWAPTEAQIIELHQNTPLQAVIAASPNNPTGVMLSRERLHSLVTCCQNLGIWFISDEIYHGLTYRAGAETALAFSEDVIVINSFSKFFGLTGWRIGWMVVPEALVRPIERMTQNLSISVPYLSQIAALAALECREDAQRHAQDYAQCRAYLMEHLPDCGFDQFLPPDGAFYIYADISKFGMSSVQLAKIVLERCGIAATPGLDFDPVNGHNFLRFSYAAGMDTVREAVERLKMLKL